MLAHQSVVRTWGWEHAGCGRTRCVVGHRPSAGQGDSTLTIRATAATTRSATDPSSTDPAADETAIRPEVSTDTRGLADDRYAGMESAARGCGSHVTLSEADLLWPATLPTDASTTATQAHGIDSLKTIIGSDLSEGVPLSRLALRADALDEVRTIAETEPDAIEPLVPDIVSTVESAATQTVPVGQQVLTGNYTTRVQQYGLETLATLAPDHLPLGAREQRERLLQAITTVLTSSDAIAVVRPAFDLLGTVVVGSTEITGPMLAACGTLPGVRRWLPDLDRSDTRLDAIRVLGALSVADRSVALSEPARATLREAATADDLVVAVWSTLVIERLDVPVDGVTIRASADEFTHRTVQTLCQLVERDALGETKAESSATSSLDRLLDTAGHLDPKQEQYGPAFESIRNLDGESPTALQTETAIRAIGEFAVAGCLPSGALSQRVCDVLADTLTNSDTPPVLTEAARTLERLATAGYLADGTECRAAFTALGRAMCAPNQTDPEPLAAALVELVATGSIESVTLSGLQEGTELCGPVLRPSTDLRTAIQPFSHPEIPDHVPALVVDAFRSSLGSISGPANEVPATVLAVMQRRGLLPTDQTYATSCRHYCEATVSSDDIGLRTQAHVHALAHSGLLEQADLSEPIGILAEGIEPASDSSSAIAAERLKTLSEAGCLDTHHDFQPVVDVLCRAAHPTTEPDPTYPVETLTALAATNSLPADAEYTSVVSLIEDVLGRSVDTTVLSRLVERDRLADILSRSAADASPPPLLPVARLLAAFLTNGYISDSRNLDHIAALFAAHIPAPDSDAVLQRGSAFGLGIVAAEHPLADVTFTESVRRLIAWTDPELTGDGEIAALTVAVLAREGYIDASFQLSALGPLRRMATTSDSVIDSRQPLVCLGTLLQSHPEIPQVERDRTITTLLESVEPGAETHTFAAGLALSRALSANPDSKAAVSVVIEDLCTSIARLSTRPERPDIEDFLALSGVSLDTHTDDLDETEAGAVLDILAAHVDPERLLPAIADAVTSIAADGSKLADTPTVEQLIATLHTNLVDSQFDCDLSTVDEEAAELGPVLVDYLGDPDGTTATQIQTLDLVCYLDRPNS